MNAQELKLDYFKFYDAANQDAGNIVALQGQFDRQRERVRLNYLNLFANPVSKNKEPMYDKNAHLTWYDVYDPVPDPVRKVTFENQFGKARIITGRSYALLVPTWKIERGSAFPEALDHYKVYQVLDAEPINKTVQLEDQFGRSEGRIFHPLFFGVPVKKWHEGQTFGIHNESAHLVIYRMYPDTQEKTVKTRDQFSARLLHLFRGVLLGAPSLKLDWSELD